MWQFFKSLTFTTPALVIIFAPLKVHSSFSFVTRKGKHFSNNFFFLLIRGGTLFSEYSCPSKKILSPNLDPSGGAIGLKDLWSSEQANMTIPFEIKSPIFRCFKLYITTQRPCSYSIGQLRTPEAIFRISLFPSSISSQ